MTDVTWSKLEDLNLEREGWRIVSISDFGKAGAKSVVNGPFGSDLLTSELTDEGVPVIYSGDVRPGVYSRKKVAKSFVTEEKAASLGAFETKTNDVVIAKVGDPPGNSAVYRGQQNAVVTQDVIRIRPSPSVDPGFLSAVLNCDVGRRQVHRIMISGTRGRVSLTDFKKMKLPVAPLPEQRKIAEILSTWDRAIETTETLLANARTQKRALMQTLLTGKRRFPEFEGREWKEVKIGSVSREVSVRNKEDAALPVISCSKVVGFVNSLDYFKKQVFSDDLTGYKVIRRGQIGYPSNHVEEGSIGIQNLYDAALVSPIYTVFEPSREIDAMFLYRVLKTDHYRQRFAAATNASVDRRGSLRWKAFSLIKVPLPSLEEQKRITAALDVADAEIVSREAQVEKLRTEKQALMQQLLTGKRRVALE